MKLKCERCQKQFNNNEVIRITSSPPHEYLCSVCNRAVIIEDKILRKGD